MEWIERAPLRTVCAAVLVGVLASLAGCAYSFTGSSVPAHLKTIAIPLFDDQSGSGEPSLRESFTNKLIDRFTQDNSLEVADKSHADSVLEGIIVSLKDEPLVVAKGESVTKRRVTITIKAKYQDLKLHKQLWDKEFSNTGDYEIAGGPVQRQGGIDGAIEKLTQDLLLETVSGW